MTFCSGHSRLLFTIDEQKRVHIYDFGLLARKRSLQNFLEYELKPYLLKNFGTLDVQTLLFIRPCKNEREIVEEFRKTFNLKFVQNAQKQHKRSQSGGTIIVGGSGKVVE